MPSRGSAALKTYWRQVHEVQRQTHIRAADARRATKILREESGIRTAHASKQHRDTVREAVEAARAPYDNLNDWISTWNAWDGDYEEYDLETGVDYGE